MDLIRKQRERRKRGIIVTILATLFFANAIRAADEKGVPGVVFAVIYSSGMCLGAGVAMLVASAKMTREIQAAQGSKD